MCKNPSKVFIRRVSIAATYNHIAHSGIFVNQKQGRRRTRPLPEDESAAATFFLALPQHVRRQEFGRIDLRLLHVLLDGRRVRSMVLVDRVFNRVLDHISINGGRPRLPDAVDPIHALEFDGSTRRLLEQEHVDGVH